MIIEHHPTKSDKLCFLSEEELFTLIVHVNKTIVAAFITHLVRHPEKMKTRRRTNNVLFPGL